MKVIRNWINRIRQNLPGMRILKTVVAILLCLLLDHARGAAYPYNAAIAAIICLQPNAGQTKQGTINRLMGTLITGVYAYAMILFTTRALGLTANTWGFIAAVATLIIPLVQLLVRLKKPGSVAVSLLVYLLIMTTVTQENADHSLANALKRVLDVFLGVGLAILIDGLPLINRLGDKYEGWRTRMKAATPNERAESTDIGSTEEKSKNSNLKKSEES